MQTCAPSLAEARPPRTRPARKKSRSPAPGPASVAQRPGEAAPRALRPHCGRTARTPGAWWPGRTTAAPSRGGGRQRQLHGKGTAPPPGLTWTSTALRVRRRESAAQRSSPPSSWPTPWLDEHVVPRNTTAPCVTRGRAGRTVGAGEAGVGQLAVEGSSSQSTALPETASPPAQATSEHWRQQRAEIAAGLSRSRLFANTGKLAAASPATEPAPGVWRTALTSEARDGTLRV